MISFETITKLFSFDPKGKYCIEIEFSVKGHPNYQFCWMGKCPDRDHNDKATYWYGLAPDGSEAYNYASFAEFSSAAVFNGRSLEDIWDKIEILSIDGCDPEDRLQRYLVRDTLQSPKRRSPMERYSLLEPLWRRVLYILFPFLFLAVMDILLVWMDIAAIIELIQGEIDWLTFLCILGTFPFTALFIALAFWILRDCFTSVYFSAEGIEQLVFGKLRCFIPWDELAEVGIGIYSWRGGPSFCLYFADRTLEDTERVDFPISIRDEKNTRLIQPGDIDLKKLEELKTFCPLTVPPFPSLKEKRCALVSYRRSRLPDGSWGEPHLYGIPDARQTLHRYREECRRGR